jgi:large subunit ribosomal protein L35
VGKKKNKKYKLKTHKATAKRFQQTGSGKIVRTSGPKSHLRRNKSDRTKKGFSKMTEVQGSKQRKRIKRLLPYMGKYNTRSSRRGGGSKK